MQMLTQRSQSFQYNCCTLKLGILYNLCLGLCLYETLKQQNHIASFSLRPFFFFYPISSMNLKLESINGLLKRHI